MDIFRAGVYVVIHGLQNSPQYNGCRGRITGVYDTKYTVNLLDENEQIKVKKSNLQRQSPP